MRLTPPDMLCFSIYSAAQAVQQAYKPLLDPLGLTYPQYLVLSLLWSGDGQTVGALGRALHLESNTLTPLVKRLEAQGLVARHRDQSDERQVRVHLTDAGRGLSDPAQTVPGCFISHSGLSLGQAQALRDDLLALRARLEAPAGG